MCASVIGPKRLRGKRMKALQVQNKAEAQIAETQAAPTRMNP
jgi:hypothetical protein